jgi:pimeloyl-ACP methyl ester carboxylesterase
MKKSLFFLLFTLAATFGSVFAYQVNDCEEFSVVSSIDGERQKAEICFSQKKSSPLLVFFPAWNGGHPYYEEVKALVKNKDWNLLVVKPRGANEGEIGSFRSIQDVLDAIDYARFNSLVDGNRIYGIGVSGGGYMALMTAMKYPNLFAGISVWAAMTDIQNWRNEMLLRTYPQHRKYAQQINEALGDPEKNLRLYLKASPIYYAKTGKNPTKIDINAGITDGYHGTVAVAHSLEFYNLLASNDAKISKDDYERLVGGDKDIFKLKIMDSSFQNRAVLYRKESNGIRLTVFDGDHEMIPNAAIEWLSKQRR